MKLMRRVRFQSKTFVLCSYLAADGGIADALRLAQAAGVSSAVSQFGGQLSPAGPNPGIANRDAQPSAAFNDRHDRSSSYQVAAYESPPISMPEPQARSQPGEVRGIQVSCAREPDVSSKVNHNRKGSDVVVYLLQL
jgi:hypothetical protein